MRRLAVVQAAFVAFALVLALVPAELASAAGSAPAGVVTYRPPVDAPIVDPFRPPPENWNAGNRGVEYATQPGTPVAASAAGEVVFAGQVGGELHVVVLHDDGIRTSYSFLASVSVHRGDKVRQGQTVGTTGTSLHFGARAGDAYLDPTLLFGGGPPEVHLVPDEQRRPQTESQERTGLLRQIAGYGARAVADGAGRAVAGGAAAIGWARDTAVQQVQENLDELRGAVHFAFEANPAVHIDRLVDAFEAWRDARRTCTPASVVPPRLQDRHLVVMVAGLGSKPIGDSIDAVDTAALGYAHDDVLRYSYNGGTVPEHPYAASDTNQDIRRSARLLRELLERLARDHPGVPIDIVAHSQGGIVARTALTHEFDGMDPRLPPVSALITLSTPHQGAPIATGLTMLGHTDSGQTLEAGVSTVAPTLVDPAGDSIHQLAEESTFMADLNRRPLPAGLRVTSIGAREDLIVPAGLTRLDGANNVTVSVPGHLAEHSALPGSPEARREIALGLAGMAPTCQTLADTLLDAAVSDAIRTGETQLGGSAWAGGRYVDKRLEPPPAPPVHTKTAA